MGELFLLLWVAFHRFEEEEYLVQDDDARLSAIRLRGERLILCQSEQIRAWHGVLGPVKLKLVDQDDTDQVSIMLDDETENSYIIMTSPEWIEAATDDEILATTAHELGHAVLGHCHGNTHHWRRRMRHWLWVGMGMGIATTVGAGMTWTSHLIEAMAWISLGLILPPLAIVLWIQHKERQQEYAADRFVVQFAFTDAFLTDLAKDKKVDGVKRWKHKVDQYLSVFHSHPTLARRAKALKATRWPQKSPG